MRGKVCGGCNTIAGNYATAVISWKTYGGCNLHAQEILRRYNTSVVNYATVAIRSKACGGCNTSARNYATGAMRGKNCGGCKRGNTRKLPIQAYSLFHELHVRSELFGPWRVCHGHFIPIFLTTSSNIIFESVTEAIWAMYTQYRLAFRADTKGYPI